jgi:hypothetical protein
MKFYLAYGFIVKTQEEIIKDNIWDEPDISCAHMDNDVYYIFVNSTAQEVIIDDKNLISFAIDDTKFYFNENSKDALKILKIYFSCFTTTKDIGFHLVKISK